MDGMVDEEEQLLEREDGKNVLVKVAVLTTSVRKRIFALCILELSVL
jgi:hypothetical protein